MCRKKGASNVPRQKRTCDVCGKPLERELCTRCRGKGTIRKLLFFTVTCPECEGTGEWWRCPDYFDHLLAEFHAETPTHSRPPSLQEQGTLGSKVRPRLQQPGIRRPAVAPAVPPPARTPAHLPATPPASPPTTLPAAPPASPPSTPPVRPPIRLAAAPPASPPATPPVRPPARPPAR